MKILCWIYKNKIAISGGLTEKNFSGSMEKANDFSFTFCTRFMAIVISALFLGACGNASKSGSNIPVQLSQENSAAKIAMNSDHTGIISPPWLPLRNKLVADGLPATEVDRYLADLQPVPTQSPMGRKMLELYRHQFLPKNSKLPQQRYYTGVVTPANATLCRDFIKIHKSAFVLAQERYGVSPAIAASLLFVETRLGKVLGDRPENAFYTLASMAVSTKPSDINEWLPKMSGYENHLAWLKETMRKRSDWAYNETRALLTHVIRDKIPVGHLPGSIYGAVGLCQFMPSNITPYGDDGDGDGKIDLFTVADAVASLANYLHKHGWRAGQDREKQFRLLMTYNHSQVYANTILALADLVNEPVLTGNGK